MFTGLVEDIGEIRRIVPAGSGRRLAIACGLPPAEVALGDSIAVDGVCLTVTACAPGGFSVDVSPESLEKTTLGRARAGRKVNLERALRLSDRLGGHLVTGHIDATATIGAMEVRGDFVQLDIAAPDSVMRYIVAKGSVAIDGISLTVNSCLPRGFRVMIIPHSLARTTLQQRTVGEAVNIENDILGKYVEKLLAGADAAASGITRAFLEKHNFL
jgi:riboflavin synthase